LLPNGDHYDLALRAAVRLPRELRDDRTKRILSAVLVGWIATGHATVDMGAASLDVWTADDDGYTIDA